MLTRILARGHERTWIVSEDLNCTRWVVIHAVRGAWNAFVAFQAPAGRITRLEPEAPVRIVFGP